MRMGAAFVVISAFTALAANAEIDIGSDLQVFWDDYIVDTNRTTATRLVHHPVFDQVVMVHDKPWEGDYCAFHNILVDKDGQGILYRMYYDGFSLGAAPKDKVKIPYHRLYICYAESRDGIFWYKPNLGLWEFNGSKANNILLDGTKPRVNWDNFMVFKDENPNCPPAERYKAVGRTEGSFGADGQGRSGATLAGFFSPDGIHFDEGRVLTRAGSFDSLNVAFWDKTRGVYHLYSRGGHNNPKDKFGDVGIRDVRHATSVDFHSWSTPTRIGFGEGKEDYPLYTNVVQPYFRNPSLLIGFPSRYVSRKEWTPNYDHLPRPEYRRFRMNTKREKNGTARWGLVVTDCVFMMSRDGQNFFREDEAFMRPGPEYPKNWVYGSCYPARGLLPVKGKLSDDDELAFYVFDNRWSGEAERLLLYRIRQDGFISRHATYAEQRVVTKPLVFNGREMLVNFSTSARGHMYVTIRDKSGRALKSVELFGDKVDRPVDFSGDLSSFSGIPVVVEFALSDADLYSFKFK